MEHDWAESFRAAAAELEHEEQRHVLMLGLPVCVHDIRSCCRRTPRAFAAFLRYAGVRTLADWRDASVGDLRCRWNAFRCHAATDPRDATCRNVGGLLNRLKDPGGRRRGRGANPSAVHALAWTSPAAPPLLLDAALSAEQAAFVRMLCALPSGGHAPLPRRSGPACARDRRPAIVVRRLPDVLRPAGLLSLAAFRASDGEALRRACQMAVQSSVIGPSQARIVLRFLRSCRAHPQLDEFGRFASHLDCVPAAFLERWPQLWEYPHAFAQWMRRQAFDDAETEHILFLTEAAVLGKARRTAEALRRTRAAQSRVFRQALALRPQLDPTAAGRPWTSLIARDADLGDLYRILAKIIGAHSRRLRPRGVVTSSAVVDRDKAPELWRCFFQSLVRAEVFWRVGQEQRLSARRLLVERRREARDFPRYYALFAPERVRTVKASLTRADVEAILQRAGTPCERAILLLLCTLGLRIGAVARLRIEDVYDADRGTVRPAWAVLEKGCVVRHCIPNQATRDAVRTQVEALDPRTSPLLFPPRRRPTVPRPTAVVGPLQAVLKRAGRAHVNPHQFRKYVINQLLAQGWGIEDVAKWIGHRDMSVTFNSYAENRRLACGIDDEAGNDNEDQLKRAQRQCGNLLRLVREMLPPEIATDIVRRSLEEEVVDSSGSVRAPPAEVAVASVASSDILEAIIG